MDFSLSEEHSMLQGLARRYTQEELLPLEREYLRFDRLPDDVMMQLERKARSLGLWALTTPRELGGGGVGQLGSCLVREETAKAVLGAMQGDGIGGDPSPILYHCTEAQKERFFYPVIRGEKKAGFAQTEPNVGSDPATLEMRATRVGDTYVLDGVKTFIGGAGKEDFYTVLVRTNSANKGRGGVSCIVVEQGTPGFQVARVIGMMAGEAPVELVFENCVVPAENRIGEEGEGFVLGQRFLGIGRLRFGPNCVGIAERALSMAVSYSKQRVTFGRPIAERQAIQWMLADSATEIHAARLMTYHAAAKADRGEDFRQEVSIVKVFASEMVNRVVDRAVQVHGAVGLSKDLPLEKMYRQVRHKRIGEGTAEIQRFIIARNLLRD